jgi:hypothetical protein
VIPVLFFSLVVIAIAASSVKYEPPPQAVVEIYLSHSRADALALLTVFVALIGPAIEEVFFRGFAYRALRSTQGTWKAACMTSGIFAAMHMNLVAVAPIFILGVFLCYLYEKTGSLVPSMTVHTLHNFGMVTLTLTVKSLSS